MPINKNQIRFINSLKHTMRHPISTNLLLQKTFIMTLFPIHNTEPNIYSYTKRLDHTLFFPKNNFNYHVSNLHHDRESKKKVLIGQFYILDCKA